ncbi:MAG: L-rhamnose mutarotase [Bacteroidota bacterium]
MRNLFLIIFAVFLPVQACMNETNEQTGENEVRRYAWVIRVKPEKLDEYKALHANPWPDVNKMLKECHISNYSIYYRDGYLFSYLEYSGTDFDADMQKMAEDSTTRAWWDLTDPCQVPVESAGEGVWWADLEEVYHLD